MLCLLTPTGGRPEGMALLARSLKEQTYRGAARWIVVDDCDPATPVQAPWPGIEPEVIRPGWRWSPGMNTQAASMAAGLAVVPRDATLLVLEDDDAYLPGHIENQLQELKRAELAGERVARYYNVATGRYKEIPSDRHASLAATACRGAALAVLRGLCAAGSRRIDMDLWQAFRGSRALVDSRNVVGIKGLPGRAGIGVGHRADFGTPDPDGEVLAEWLGPDRAEAYAAFRRQ